jgi:Domain of unknown function (DUF3786)/Putative Fe-S cluster
MSEQKLTAMHVFKHTKRDNCGECGLSNCMAFSALVVQGKKDPFDCPYLDKDFADSISEHKSELKSDYEYFEEEFLDEMKKSVKGIDFHEAAKRLGGTVNEERFSVHCLGRIFELDQDGNMYSICHVNNWIHLPLINYVTNAKGTDPTGEWVTFRSLKDVQDWKRYFEYRCEERISNTAFEHTDIFLDILDLFGTGPAKNGPSADYSAVLYPFPKVPVLFCFWREEGKFGAKLGIYFDRSVEDNLPPGSRFQLVRGMAEMFEKIIDRHELPSI